MQKRDMSAFRLEQEKSLLFLIDAQERLVPAVSLSEETVERCRILVEGCALMKLPMIVTEQYPKGLGPTVSVLHEPLTRAGASFFDKLTFTSLTDDVRAALKAAGRTQIILCGMETHVCCLQTTRDLLAEGYQVYPVADALTSRSLIDRKLALATMREMGAHVMSVESVLFNLLGVAGTPTFKAVSALVTGRS